MYASLGFSTEDAAKFLQVSPRTVQLWVSGRQRIPYAAFKLLRVMLHYELPGKAWEGWSLSAGRLYTPEGFELAPHEVSWWSLLVRQARLFRSMYKDKFPAGPVGELAIAPARPARDVLVTRPGSLTGENGCKWCQKARTQQRRGLRADAGRK